MSYRTEQILKVVGIVLTVALVAGMCWVYFRDRREQDRQAAAWESLADAALPYEKEKRELEQELSQLQEAAQYVPEHADLMIGFLVSDASDMAYVREKSAQYGFSPIIVIDCTANTASIASCLEAVEAGWEILLYTPEFSDEIHASVVFTKQLVESMGKQDTGIFLLRNGYHTEHHVSLLAESGFVGYATYHDSPVSGQTEDGLVYFDYSLVRSGGTVTSDRLAEAYAKKAAFLVVLDMAGMQSGALTDKNVTAILDDAQKYAAHEDCSFSTVADTVATLSEINQIEADNRAEHAARVAAIEARLGELDAIISGIYGGT